MSAVIVESAAPPKAQKDSKLAGFMKLFERAWFASGQETVGNRPYVERKKMLDFLINNDGNTEEAAKAMVKTWAIKQVYRLPYQFPNYRNSGRRKRSWLAYY